MRKDDLFDLIVGKREAVVKMNHLKLIEMARVKRIKNYTLLTKRELQELLGIENVDNKISSKLYIFIKASDAKQLTFRTQKEAMNFFRISGSSLAEEIKNKRLIVDTIEYRFERH